MKRGILIVVAVVCACTGATHSNAPPVDNFALPATDFVLPSGLRILFQDSPGYGSVGVATVVDAGSRFDPPGKEGLAHLVEHLWFRLDYDGQSVRDRIRDLGASYNATTHMDTTQFWTIAPEDTLVELLKLEVYRVSGALDKVDAEALEAEKRIVAAERRLKSDAPINAIDALREQLLPEGHAYVRDTWGTDKTLEGITLQDVRAFGTALYSPARVTIVVSGDLELEHMRDLLVQVLTEPLMKGQYSLQNPPTRVTGDPPAPIADVTIPDPPTIEGAVASPLVYTGWVLPAAFHGDDEQMLFALSLLASRLKYQQWGRKRGEPPRVDDVDCWLEPGTEATLALCRIETLRGADPEEIIERAREAAGLVWSGSASGYESMQTGAARYKSAMVARILAQNETIRRAQLLARSLHFTGRADLIGTSMARVNELKPAAMRSWGGRYLNRKRMAAVIVTPGQAVWETPLSPLDIDQLLTPRKASHSDDRIDRDRIRETARVGKLYSMKQMKLDNGVTVVFVHRPDVPLVRVSWLRPGGWALEPHGVDNLLWTYDYAKSPYEIAAMASGRTYATAQSERIQAASASLSEALNIFVDRVKTERLDSLTAERKAAIESLALWDETQSADIDVKSVRALYEMLYPDHILGAGAYDKEELLAVTDSRLRELYELRDRPDATLVVIAGDFDEAQARDLVTHKLSSWQGEGKPMRLRKASMPDRRRVQRIISQQSGVSDLYIACRLESADIATRELLEWYLQAQLFRSLRESSALSYSIRVSTEDFGTSNAALHVWTQVDARVLEETAGHVLGAIESIASGEINTKDFDGALWGLARHARIRDLSLYSISQRIEEAHLHGEPIESVGAFGDQLAALTGEDLAKALGSCVGREVIVFTTPANAQIEDLEARLLEAK